MLRGSRNRWWGVEIGLIEPVCEPSPEGSYGINLALVAFNRDTAAACERNPGDVLPYVGTRQAVQDMDLIRQVLGDEKRRCFRISYGIELGGVYAHLFEGHGAYDSGNGCVREAVDAYLLDGRLPAPGAVCEAEPLPEGK
ncbi:alpha/beta hydrolase [Streptomyces olivaceus]|nr:alpha/beta hydrolase [Streptomyces olivaceus]